MKPSVRCLITAAVLALAAPASALATPAPLRFVPGPRPATGAGPETIAVGDFNSDAHSDLAIIDSGTNQVRILLGTGDGHFVTGRSVATGQDPQGLAVGDFNHDGHLDLAVADRDSSDVTVLLGDGTGKFNPSALLTTNIPNDFTYGDPGPIAIGDFNADGNPDIAVNTLGPGGRGEVETFAGGGNGTFAPAVLDTPKDEGVGSAVSMSVADLNQDGRPDLVLLNGYSDQHRVQTLLGTGGGTFADGPTAPVGSGPNQLVVADFTGDGHQDVAVTNHDDGTVTLLLGDGHGNLTPTATLPAGPTPEGIAAGDFNGDGHLDIAVVNRDPGLLTILLGNGQGAFTATEPRATGSAPEHLATGRFDADGVDDLAVENFNDAAVAVLISTPPSNKFMIVGHRAEAHGRLTITLRAPDAGRFSAVGTATVSRPARRRRKAIRQMLVYARGSATARGAVKLTLELRPTGAASRALTATGRLPVKVQITFTPQGGTSAAKTLTVIIHGR